MERGWFTARRSVVVVGLVAAALLAACGSGGEKKDTGAGAPVSGQTGNFQPSATAVAAVEGTEVPEETVATPAFPAPPEDARLARLIIPAAKVNAPLQIKGINARNEMENPDGKDNVAWYDFSSRPGFGSNAVFAGHVDWYTGERGVFWFLRDLKEGDDVVVRLSGDIDVKYRVMKNVTYKTQEAPVAELIGPTNAELVTLITCEGVFNRATQDYDLRRVVQAERIA